jgi:hypothetical protein
MILHCVFRQVQFLGNLLTPRCKALLGQLTINSEENRVISGAISPDGKYLAYSDMKGIHIKVIQTGETHAVPQPEGLKNLNVDWEIVPNWFPDNARFLANAHPPGQDSSTWTSRPTVRTSRPPEAWMDTSRFALCAAEPRRSSD